METEAAQRGETEAARASTAQLAMASMFAATRARKLAERTQQHWATVAIREREAACAALIEIRRLALAGASQAASRVKVAAGHECYR